MNTGALSRMRRRRSFACCSSRSRAASAAASAVTSCGSVMSPNISICSAWRYLGEGRDNGDGDDLGAAADVLAPLGFGGEFLEVGVERMARGDDADRPAVHDHRRMAEALLVHEQQRVAE